MKKRYLVDKKVLSILLAVEEDAELNSAYLQYVSVLGNMIRKLISSYINGLGLDEATKASIAAKAEDIFSGKYDNLSESEVDNLKADEELKKHLDNPELTEKINEMVDQFNKYVYDTYSKSLDDAAKKELDDYIKSVEDAKKASVSTLEEIYAVLLDTRNVEKTESSSANSPAQPQVNLSSLN